MLLFSYLSVSSVTVGIIFNARLALLDVWIRSRVCVFVKAKMVLGTFEKRGFVNVCLEVHIFLLAIYPKDMRIDLSYIRHTKR